MSVREFSTRTVVVYDLPLPRGEKIDSPEQVILRFEDGGSIDVGSLCYLRRDNNPRRATSDGRRVDMLSFSPVRAKHVQALIMYFRDEYSNGGKKSLTLAMKCRYFSTVVMEWIDQNGGREIFDDESSARRVLRGYILNLKEKVAQNVININYAHKLRNLAVEMCEGIMGADGLDCGLPMIARNAEASETTSPPCEIAQSKSLALAQSLFDGLSDLVVNGRPYPFRLEMPKYLGWAEDCLWVFPINMWCVPPHRRIDDRFSESSYGLGYDYNNGRLTTFEKLEALIPLQQNKKKVVGAKNRIAIANNNLRDHNRMFLSARAVASFVWLFIANTGMNKAQVMDLRWTDEYECCTVRQGFRTIKWRANNKICNFEISIKFLPDFKRYLALREFVLIGTECDPLFFGPGKATKRAPKKLDGSALRHLYDRNLRYIDPSLPNITPREWRAAKADWLIKNTDLSTAAKSLQHSEKTLLKHYTAGSETKHHEEMTTFFERVTAVVLGKDESVKSGIERTVGVCAAYGKPHQIDGGAPVELNCRDAEGCLFCENFRIHADSEDTRKLLSCRYCLQRASHLVTSEDQYQRLLVPIFKRIGEIVEEIRARDGQMVAQIEQEIEEGELSAFWANKLEMLLELEWIV